MSLKNFYELNLTSTPQNISILGDALIDEYYSVVCDRISPEFPIPIYKSSNNDPTIVVPGGASNVAFQLKNYNVNSILFCFLNDYLKNILNNHKLNFYDSEKTVDLIPIKKRIYQDNFPLCRLDVETEDYNTSKNTLLYLLKTYLQKHKEFSPKITICSDYNKGFWNQNFDYKKFFENTISIVDPKNLPLKKWEGCTIFKPNQKEAKELSGYNHWEDQAKYFIDKIQCKNVIITFAEKGVKGIVNDCYFEYFNHNIKEANSIIGAGDCFMATMATALSYDISIEESIEIAFKAGSLYVTKKYNKPIYPWQLYNLESPTDSKLIGKSDIKMFENRNYKLCFTNGCFDIFHEGHLALLKYCKSISDKVILAINTDESIKLLKGPNRPINNLNKRISLLKMLDYIDYIIPFEEETPIELIKEIKPDILVKGGDYTIDKIKGSKIVKDCRIFPLVKDASTSLIINTIMSSSNFNKST